MKNLKLILLILLSFFLFGCPDKDEEMDSEITIINKSDKSLLMISNNEIFPDTMFRERNNPFQHRENDKFTIKPNSNYNQKVNWRAAFAHYKSTKVMTIFLFDKAIVDTVSWDKIRKDYLVAKRYEYTLKQLDSLNWTITYP